MPVMYILEQLVLQEKSLSRPAVYPDRLQSASPRLVALELAASSLDDRENATVPFSATAQ